MFVHPDLEPLIKGQFTSGPIATKEMREIIISWAITPGKPCFNILTAHSTQGHSRWQLSIPGGGRPSSFPTYGTQCNCVRAPVAERLCQSGWWPWVWPAVFTRVRSDYRLVISTVLCYPQCLSFLILYLSHHIKKKVEDCTVWVLALSFYFNMFLFTTSYFSNGQISGLYCFAGNIILFWLCFLLQ